MNSHFVLLMCHKILNRIDAVKTFWDLFFLDYQVALIRSVRFTSSKTVSQQQLNLWSELLIESFYAVSMSNWMLFHVSCTQLLVFLQLVSNFWKYYKFSALTMIWVLDVFRMTWKKCLSSLTSWTSVDWLSSADSR